MLYFLIILALDKEKAAFENRSFLCNKRNKVVPDYQSVINSPDPIASFVWKNGVPAIARGSAITELMPQNIKFSSEKKITEENDIEIEFEDCALETGANLYDASPLQRQDTSLKTEKVVAAKYVHPLKKELSASEIKPVLSSFTTNPSAPSAQFLVVNPRVLPCNPTSIAASKIIPDLLKNPRVLRDLASNNLNTKKRTFTQFDPNDTSSIAQLERLTKQAIEYSAPNGGFSAPRVVDVDSSARGKQFVTAALRGKKTAGSVSSGNPQKIDLEAPEIKALIQAKSLNENLVMDCENEQLGQLVDVLGKKEEMMNQMLKIESIKIKAYSCADCNNGIMERMSVLCKEKGHDVVRLTATKRFFACDKCNAPAISLSNKPRQACQSCGNDSFKKASMYRGKELAETPAEQLLVRGVEHPLALRCV